MKNKGRKLKKRSEITFTSAAFNFFNAPALNSAISIGVPKLARHSPLQHLYSSKVSSRDRLGWQKAELALGLRAARDTNRGLEDALLEEEGAGGWPATWDVVR